MKCESVEKLRIETWEKFENSACLNWAEIISLVEFEPAAPWKRPLISLRD